MKEIKLTMGQVTRVDDDMFEELNQFKWYAQKSRKTFYARRSLKMVNGKCPSILMHHVIIGKPPKGKVTDHEDGNGLHNEIYNLSHVTNRQNCQNMKNITPTSTYPGVHWDKERKKWQVQAEINGKHFHLGRFETEIEGYEKYCNAVESISEHVILTGEYTHDPFTCSTYN